MKLDREWLAITGAIGQAFERLEKEDYGEREFVRYEKQRWVIAVRPRRIEFIRTDTTEGEDVETFNRIADARAGDSPPEGYHSATEESA